MCAGTALGVLGVAGGVAATLASMAGTLTTAVMAQIGATVGIGGAIGAAIATKIKITELPQVGVRGCCLGWQGLFAWAMGKYSQHKDQLLCTRWPAFLASQTLAPQRTELHARPRTELHAQMVAAFHSLVGLAAAATSIASVMAHAGSPAELAHLDSLHKFTAVLGDW